MGFNAINAGNRAESRESEGLSAIAGDFAAESHGLTARSRDRLPVAEQKSLKFRRFMAMLIGRSRPGNGPDGYCCGTQRENRGKSR